ncbi:MAG: type I restriction enzyme M protein [Rugosibacter sp.]|nr:type I restriction enzyme M protein [Rugosibacter sp.]
MLDTTTKRRIDTARDILVGKVPDPKSQVEQITIALIYKFMDDMDAESEELGGKRKFFTGDFARYGWAKLMRSGLGGHETLNLYAEGITKMPENPGIPPLFRDIFKNAYLPYRDPETLKSFLKIIDEFAYDHSERLGDAFEYLLSVLGSQGDAGQFRTPRHIIDFMVEVLAPQKADVILDPACGTAGFLISAYKHILRSNTDAKGNSTLTPDDKGRLAKNFKGYDISPDMVRLSLVNLYLHGFTDPHIFEYDTLTSEERWNDFADVILANPPFMSPKGGIKPHKRFSIQAKRSEVLFVDYMAEHLTPTGRAAIIVPEGIIFQSQTAYKELRKLLVENSLVAVVSLPAGCFNPYSGVKTSILILDKSLARQSDSIAFFKVENDGYGLGAQRRAFEKNDLPQVQAELAEYLQALRSGQSVDELQPTCGLIVAKEKIAANGDYNLSGERYREGAASNHSFPLVFLGEEGLFRVESGGTPKSDVEEYWGGGIPWATLVDLPATDFISEITATKRTISEKGLRESSAKMIPANSIVVSTRATIGRIAINRVPIATNQGFKNVVIEDSVRAIPEYVALALTRLVPTMQAWATGGTFAEISKSKFCELQIPLPPLELQKEIVAEIEGYQKVINSARAVLDHYRPHIPIHPDWPMVGIGDVCQIGDGNHSSNYPKASEMVASGVPFIRGTNLVGARIDSNDMRFISPEKHLQLKKGHLRTGDVIFTNRGEIGKVAIVDSRFNGSNLNSQLAWLRAKDELLSEYLLTVLQSSLIQDRLHVEKNGATLQQFTIKQLTELKIPLPSLVTQQAIVAEIEAEQALVAANRELIVRFEQKIQATLARVWGEDAPEFQATGGES